MYWAEFPTGELTAAKARGQEQNFYDLLSIITGLSSVTAKRRIGKASGRTLLRNVFKGRWPVDDDIGDITVAEALELDLVDAIAFVVGQRSRAVRAELRQYELDTRVRDIYYEQWPTNASYVGDEEAPVDEDEDEEFIDEDDDLELVVDEDDEEQEVASDEDEDEVSVESLSEMSVGRARREGLEWAIAEVTGLTEKGVTRLMSKSHGRTLVRNVFASHWPEMEDESEPVEDLEVDEVEQVEEEVVEQVEAEEPEQDDESFDDDDVEVIEITEDELGDWSVAKAKREQVIDLISQVTGLPENVASRKLDKAHGRTLVRNVFEGRWPERVDEQPSTAHSAEQLPLPMGRSAAKSPAVPGPEALGDLTAEDLAEMTVAQVKKGKYWKAIAAVTGLTTPSVRRRIAKHGARVNVLTIFADRWPGQGGDDEEVADYGDPDPDPEVEQTQQDDELGPVALGGLSVGRARREGREEEISNVVGLSVATVRRRMDKVHGRTLVRKAFDSKWPAADDTDSDDAEPEPAPKSEKKAKEPGPGWWRTLLNYVAERQSERNEGDEVIGTVGDRFDLIEDLGQGDFGHTYVARDNQANGKVVVLKVAKDGLADSPEQLVEELHSRVDMNNANVCRCLEVTEIEGDVALVMEHCGVSVQDIIDEFQAIPPNIAVQVIRKAAHGLNYAHQKKIFHGALSPQNVLIDSSGKVKVTDFVLPPGVAAIKGSNAAFYAAPEVLADETGEAVTRASDQFSLAKILCAMLDGDQIRSKRYKFRPRKDLSAQQNQAIKRALSSKPNQRFATIDDFAQELRP